MGSGSRDALELKREVSASAGALEAAVNEALEV